MRSRRVGSITCGILLIVFGVLFLLHMLVPAITYNFIFHLWPLILVSLGVEIILSNRKAAEAVMKYDVGAILLVIILAVFSMGMGLVEFCMEHAPVYYSW